MNDGPKIIVVGNGKGGAGKTTTCMHLISILLHQNYKVGSIDLDNYQLSLTAYIARRKQNFPQLPTPQHTCIQNLPSNNQAEVNKYYEDCLQKTIEGLQTMDYIVIDTAPGNNYLSCVAHSHADIVITPINESTLDLDLLFSIQNEEYKPGPYSQMIWGQKLRRAKNNKKSMDWIVIKNRSSHIASRNKHKIDTLLDIGKKRLGFRTVAGLSERMIFRELYDQGLTLLDLQEIPQRPLTTSHVVARQELRSFIQESKILTG